METVSPLEGTILDTATVRGYPAASLSGAGLPTARTPGDLMLMDVARFDVYVTLLTVMPVTASIGAKPSVTVAEGPVPFAW